LLLSPSDSERDLVDALPNTQGIQRATRENTQAAVNAFAAAASESPANEVIFYAGGHGVLVTQEQSFVLLEDFAAEPLNKFAGAIDVASIRGALGRPTAAQRQLWLVDACAIRPSEVGKTSFQAGVRLDAALDQAPESSIVLTGAAPHTRALGAPGVSTLFSQAVIESFQMYAAAAGDDGQWGVTALELSVAVPRRVHELARQHNTEQRAYYAGFGSEQVIHELAEPPNVEVTFTVIPDEAAGLCYLTVKRGNAQTMPATCMHPPVTATVPAGLYIADVQINPPTAPFQNQVLPFDATPPSPRTVLVDV
jgi:hypothetical protein